MTETALLRLDRAQAAIAGAIECAHDFGVPIAVAVVDSGGYPVASLRMDGAARFTPSVASSKAYTVVMFETPTADLAPLASLYPELLAVVRDRGLVPLTVLGGGVPLVEGDSMVGAIGVSGGSEEQDAACARAGADHTSSDAG